MSRTQPTPAPGDAAGRALAHESPAPSSAGEREVPAGERTMMDGEWHNRIHAVDRMPPFLMNIPTDTDLWMFISSTGGLAAGRRDPDGALFPYETVDRLHDAPFHTGPVTLIRSRRGGLRPVFWEPWAPGDAPHRGTERSLSKNTIGNRIVFEEIHHEAELSFRCRWSGSDETGWVRTATLANLGREPVAISLLDGLRNVLPSGVPLRLQQQASCLVDAYKRADVDPGTRLAIYSLTARISDRPEPAEELRATTVWCRGLPGSRLALSLEAVRDFRRGRPVRAERVLTGRRGNHLVAATLTIEPGARSEWHVAADTRRSHVQIASLRARLRDPDGLEAWIEESLRGAGDNLRRIVGGADGIQLTGRAEVSAHHFANVLFNCLRGGVFVENYAFPRADFAAFLEARNRRVAARHGGLLSTLPDRPTVTELRAAAEAAGDADLLRLCFEYLPLCFGRRHGDPSRPWNLFSIVVRNPDGSQALRYEGNWRDVFQNWEALTRSFPGFLPGVIARFVNASTVDGFNPYRIGRDGVDWEVPDPGHPWAGMGYWGDHQIVYLLKLLESMEDHLPGELGELLGREIFSYADVPYRLKPYSELLEDPRATIEFDGARAARAAERVAAEGHDGRYVHARDGTVHHACLLEKLIVPALARLGSLVPGGGIWMNTERPEWNDANNALPGSGVSVVTLCYLRRYLGFLVDLLGTAPARQHPVSSDVAAWLRETAGALERNRTMMQQEGLDDGDRRRLMDELGAAFSAYRARVYADGLAGKTAIDTGETLAWCRSALAHVDHAIRANRRRDGLYHSYHLLEAAPRGDRASLRPLEVMLEGQVAALSSGLVEGREAAELIDALFASPLFVAERNAFLLQPDRELPSFLERNRIPEARAAAVPLVAELLAAGDGSIVGRDAGGDLRFHADFGGARDLAAALERLARRGSWARSVARDRQAMLDLFVEVFHHREYTGRSGTMYAYEGLGCVYWHMVAKLLLAVQEVTLAAFERDQPAEVRARLARGYYRIRGGLGYERTAADYGAFPTDPYSHTPAHAGAQQPGMTGQVKEEILARFGELGVRVRGGIVAFEPVLLRRDEFLAGPSSYDYYDLARAPRSLELPAGALAFTFCQVPVVYSLTAGKPWVRVASDDGVVTEHGGARLTSGDSRTLLARRGGIARIEVGVPERALFAG